MNTRLGWGVTVILAAVIGAGEASAVDIDGKWGIGAGVFGGGGEVSVIRGRSERSAWLLELQLSGSNDDFRRDASIPGVPPSEGNANFFAVSGGPGLRHFTRPGAEFSPYYDLGLRAGYDRSHQSGRYTRTGVSASALFNFGLEYLTPWRFSVAAHSSVGVLSWRRSRVDYGDGLGDDRGTDLSASVALRPVIFVRGYF
jgi:hypothetical protein